MFYCFVESYFTARHFDKYLIAFSYNLAMWFRNTCLCLSKYLGTRYMLNRLRKCVFAIKFSLNLAIVIVAAISLIVFFVYYDGVIEKINESNSDYDENFWFCTSLTAFVFHFLLHKFVYLLKKFDILPKLEKRQCNNVVFCVTSVICVIIIYKVCSEWELAKICESMGYAFVIAVMLLCLILFDGYSDAEINNCQNCNESIGAYWAYHAYDSYYKIVLSDIQDRISSFEEKHDLKILVKKLVLVIPLSCNVTKTLSEKDSSVTHFGLLPIIETDQGANVNREYKNPVYKIETSDKNVYVASEYPNSLMTLWETRDIMNKNHWVYHRDCFIRTLKCLVEHSPCVVVDYNDLAESPKALHKVILSTLSAAEHYTVINMES